MEFITLLELFETLEPMKHKYRIMYRYIKHLKSLTEEKDKDKEVECFKQFLLSNTALIEKRFTNHILKVNREQIYLDWAISFLDDKQRDLFWDRLLQTELIMFPKGRPEPKESVVDSDEARRIMGSDPLLADVMNKVLESDALSAVASNDQPLDVSAIMSDPKFMDLASSITSSLTSGNYNEDSLARTIDTISSLVGDDVDPEVKKIITFLKKSIRDIKAKRPVDMAALMSMISSMNMGGIDLGPLMAQMLGKK